MTPDTIRWDDDTVVLVDQTALPTMLRELRISDVPALVDAIRRLAVRGAPALGVAGGYGVALAVRTGSPGAVADAVELLAAARPTAVNLARVVRRVAARIPEGPDAVLAEAHAVRDEEVAASVAMGDLGADLLAEVCPTPVRVMTICNTGGLASVRRGTALAVVQTLHERGVLADVLALETRPLLQGARLTAWELAAMGAPHHLVVDGAGPALIARGAVDVVLAGADRVAANGDVANKIGTFSLALAARHAGIPMVVVAPESTVDLDTPDGDAIHVEERDAEEVVSLAGVPTAPEGTPVVNPAFDVTPAELVTALVTDRRVVRPAAGERP